MSAIFRVQCETSGAQSTMCRSRSRAELKEALEGWITPHHRFLVGQHLRMIEPVPAGRPSAVVGWAYAAARRERRQAALDAAEERRALAQTCARAVRLCSGAGQEHLPAGPVPSPQSASGTKEGRHLGGCIDPHGRLPHVARRHLLQRPRTTALRQPRQDPHRHALGAPHQGSRIRCRNQSRRLIPKSASVPVEFLGRKFALRVVGWFQRVAWRNLTSWSSARRRNA